MAKAYNQCLNSDNDLVSIDDQVYSFRNPNLYTVSEFWQYICGMHQSGSTHAVPVNLYKYVKITPEQKTRF